MGTENRMPLFQVPRIYVQFCAHESLKNAYTVHLPLHICAIGKPFAPPSLLTLPKLAWKSDSWYEIDKGHQENSRKSKMSNFLATNNKMKCLRIISCLKQLTRFVIRWEASFSLQDKNTLKYTIKILYFKVTGPKLEIWISSRSFHS